MPVAVSIFLQVRFGEWLLVVVIDQLNVGSASWDVSHSVSLCRDLPLTPEAPFLARHYKKSLGWKRQGTGRACILSLAVSLIFRPR
ncbi:hypothetical protein Y1Q_0024353 [Alligator mississippiensis]|uniref:Secreted protein n=1 Tax=Alligator mississippiensis TaxID=8496 RepID=A0A151NJ24_ALLMI|nr:hypothetical protein Y1Q_0024353 [Alligator mississippiensis]